MYPSGVGLLVATTFLVFAPSYAAVRTTTTKALLPLEPRVVGGKSAQAGQFPYQVLLIARAPQGSFLCGGAILAPRYILTAAHCVDGLSSSNLELFAGDVERNSKNWVTAVVGVMHIHEKYDAKRYLNDIALLELTQELPVDGTNIGTLSVRSSEPPVGTNCIISGWGSLKEGGDAANILQYVSVPIVDRSECSNLLAKQIQPEELCAGFISGGKDSCQGDSGGPLVCDGRLSGVVSWGDGCAQKYKPGVYTNVLQYWTWLQERMGSDLHMEDPVTTTMMSRRVYETTSFSRTTGGAHSVRSLHLLVTFAIVLSTFLYLR